MELGTWNMEEAKKAALLPNVTTREYVFVIYCVQDNYYNGYKFFYTFWAVIRQFVARLSDLGNVRDSFRFGRDLSRSFCLIDKTCPFW